MHALLLPAVARAALSGANESTFRASATAAFAAWRQNIAGSGSYIQCSPSGGLGNTLASVISSGILALYFNKPISCGNCPDFIHFPACQRASEDYSRFPDIEELYRLQFARGDARSFEMWFFAPDHLLIHGQIGAYLFSVFGPYAMYYIGNYFFSVPRDIRARAEATLAKIPRAVRSVGVHVRTHFHTVPAYMTDGERGCALIAGFVQARWGGRPFQLALATDAPSIAAALRRHIPSILQTGVDGFPDGDVHAAVVDFAMLQGCDEVVLTYRSTFSMMVAALANKTAYWYADEWPRLVRFTCSQTGMASGVYQSHEPFNDKTNTRHHVMEKHERALRLYNRYYVV
jgi:hypothetical protein